MIIIYWINLLRDLGISLSCAQLSLRQMYYRLNRSWWLSTESIADILHPSQVSDLEVVGPNGSCHPQS